MRWAISALISGLMSGVGLREHGYPEVEPSCLPLGGNFSVRCCSDTTVRVWRPKGYKMVPCDGPCSPPDPSLGAHTHVQHAACSTSVQVFTHPCNMQHIRATCNTFVQHATHPCNMPHIPCNMPHIRATCRTSRATCRGPADATAAAATDLLRLVCTPSHSRLLS